MLYAPEIQELRLKDNELVDEINLRLIKIIKNHQIFQIKHKKRPSLSR